MLASFVIMFREALEAALIIGIIAAYLSKIGREELRRYLYVGTGLAIVASVIGGLIFMLVYGGLEGRTEKIFEGIASLIAAVVLTTMIFWMAKNAKKIKGEMQEKIDISVSTGQTFGIATLAFIAVFREGVETVLFLGAMAVRSPLSTLTGAALGLGTVIVLTILMFRGVYQLDIQKFFKYTSVILVIFAAGLTAFGVHELNEAGVIPSVVEPVWDINPSLNPDGSYPALHEKGVIGLLLKSLIGYNGNPSLTEVLAYLGYWLVIGTFVIRTYKPRPTPVPT